MLKKLKNIFLLALVVTLMVSCGTTQNKTEASNDETSEKDTFIYAIDGDPTSINPITSSDRWGLTFINTVYSPLVRVNAYGVYENVLADNVVISEDGLKVTVTLKDNLKWSDGEPLTAEDVVFTYQTKADKKNGNYSTLWLNDEPIQFVAENEKTVSFILPSVSAAVANNITTLTYIMPKHIYENVTDFTVNQLEQVVGSGPYKLKEYKKGEYISFEANEYYYDGVANIPNLIFRIVANADSRKVALQTGEVDASFVLPSEIQDFDQEGLDVYAYSENRIGYLGFNTATKELSDVRVRQAIFYALNKEEMDKAAYISEAYYTLPYSILPSSNAFYYDGVEKYEQNLDKAKELLKEAGVTNLKLNLGFNSNDVAQNLQATLIQQQLAQIGVTVELMGGDSTALFTELRKKGSIAYNMLLGGYIMGNDPDQYRPLFTAEGRSNYFQLNNEETDHLFDLGAVEMDTEKRREIYNELQLKLSELAFIYPIVDNKKVLAVNNRIGNVEEAGLIPIYTLKDFSKLTVK